MYFQVLSNTTLVSIDTSFPNDFPNRISHNNTNSTTAVNFQISDSETDTGNDKDFMLEDNLSEIKRNILDTLEESICDDEDMELTEIHDNTIIENRTQKAKDLKVSI